MIGTFIFLIQVILCVALKTLAERKVKGAKQRRVGPNKVGFLGLLQPFADGFKLILKETIIPTQSNLLFLQGAPFLFFFQALVNWQIIPLSSTVVLSELLHSGILITVAIAELSIYGVLFSGWSANSKFPLLGSQRSTAQKISYSIALSIIYLVIIYTTGSQNIKDVLDFQEATPFCLPLLPQVQLFSISAVLECNRAPADLPEAESEQVSGFMTEHSAVSFAYFFLGEYTNKQFIAQLFSIQFLGNTFCQPFQFFFFWLRASLPRIRFDHLISFGWTQLQPFLVGYFILLPPFLYLI